VRRAALIASAILLCACSSGSSSGLGTDGGGASGTGGMAGSGGASGTTAGDGGGDLCTVHGAACDAATPDDLTGHWLFGFSAIVPTKPILFFADVTASAVGGQLEWQWTLVPLDAKTRTPVPGAPPVEVAATPIPPDGKWSADLPPMDVPGAANFISGSDLTADVALSGEICGSRNFLCGDMSGQLIKPFPADLEGSTWTLQKLQAPGSVPAEIYVDCACTKAEAPQ
jgi:hypothetical protein